MEFDALRRRVQDSTAEEWHRVPTGPTYRERSHVWTEGSDRTVHTSVDWHTDHAVYRPDVDLSMTWGMDRSYDPTSMGSSRDDHFEWSKNFPDPQVTVFFAEVFWRGALVDREHLISVDGGRGVVPLGRARRRPGAETMSREPTDYYETCTQWEHDLARLIDTMTSGHDFDRYFRGTGYVIEG